MTLSGPKDCRGSMKDARMRPHFLHSPGGRERLCQLMRCGMRWGDPLSLTSHRRGQRVVEERRHGVDGMPMMMRYNQKCPGQDKKSAVGMD